MSNWVKGLCIAVASIVWVSCDKDDDDNSVNVKEVRTYKGEGLKMYTYAAPGTQPVDSVFEAQITYIRQKDSAYFTWNTITESEYDAEFEYNKDRRFVKRGIQDTMSYRVVGDSIHFDYHYVHPVTNDSKRVQFNGIIK